MKTTPVSEQKLGMYIDLWERDDLTDEEQQLKSFLAVKYHYHLITGDRRAIDEQVEKDIQEEKHLSFNPHTYLTNLTNLTHPNLPNNPNQKEIEQQYMLGYLLATERPKFAQLKCGIHDGTFYYGTILYKGETPLTCVVTSNREVFVKWNKSADDIKEKFGLFYRYEFEYEALDGHVSIKVINEYLNGRKAKTLGELFEKIVKTNKRFMWYPDDEAHEIIALDVISSYFLPVFEAKGRVFLEAEAGSGKTRQCSLYKLMAFNSIMSNDITKSAFFRVMESTCGTLIIDDFDMINQEQKDDVLQHYRTGYKNTSKSVRVGETKSRRLENFRNYGHVVMNNTSGLADIDLQRSIPLPIMKYEGKETKEDITEQDELWASLRDELFVLGLCSWKEVQEAYKNIRSGLQAREFEISRSLLVIASLIDEELQERVEKWLSERFVKNSYHDLDTNWLFLALSQFKDKENGFRVSNTDLTEYVSGQALNSNDRDYDRQKRGVRTFIGREFGRLGGIFSVVRPQNKAHYELKDKDMLVQYLKTKKWLFEDEQPVEEKIVLINNPDDLAVFVAGHKDNPLVDEQEIVDNSTSEADAQRFLAEAKKKGDVYSSKKGFWGAT